MTPEASGALKSIFSDIWSLLGSFTFPGTNLTGQHLLLAPLGAIVLITVLRKILDIGGASISSAVHIGYGSSHYPDKGNKGQED